MPVAAFVGPCKTGAANAPVGACQDNRVTDRG